MNIFFQQHYTVDKNVLSASLNIYIHYSSVLCISCGRHVDYERVSRVYFLQCSLQIFSQEKLTSFLPKHGLILELDKTGNIVRSLHDPTGIQSDASEIEEKDGVLYIGSYHLAHLGRLYLMAV